MYKVLLYGSLICTLVIAGWFYVSGEKVPDGFQPVVLLLLALMSYGYAGKAKEDGDFGAGNSKIRRDKYPRIFKTAVFLSYLFAMALVIWAVYLLVK